MIQGLLGRRADHGSHLQFVSHGRRLWRASRGRCKHIGIEIRSDQVGVAAMLVALNHPETAACVRAERQVSRVLGGSCQVPLGAHATLQGDTLHITGFVANPDGSQFIHDVAAGNMDDPEAVGQILADKLLAQGARAILDALPAA